MESHINLECTGNDRRDEPALSDDELHGVTGGGIFLAVGAGVAIGVGFVAAVSNYPGSDAQKAVQAAGDAINAVGDAINDPFGTAREAADE